MTQRKPKRSKELGVTDAEYARLLAAQGGHCALCPNTPKVRTDPRGRKDGQPNRLHVDHDHLTIGPDGRPKVRGLLCHRCNRNLPTWVTASWCLRAADYLVANS
jgi:hypothetical protein